MGTRIIPTARYEDAKAAIAWLCEAFGFKEYAVYEEGGRVAHAELVLDGNMIMLSDRHGGEFDRLQRPADPQGEQVTMSLAVIVPEDDLPAHCARAEKNGARIVVPLEEQDYGGSNYTCRDPFGHIWSFGSFDPLAEEAET